MTQREFCYWLQGYFEINGVPEELSDAQRACIGKHLDLAEATDGKGAQIIGWMRGALDAGAPPQVLARRLAKEFRHVIDGSYENSAALNELHGGTERC